MEQCPKLAKCPFFNDLLSNMPDTVRVLKQFYCFGKWTECARYVVAEKVGKENVPANLFPGMTQRATEILENAKK